MKRCILGLATRDRHYPQGLERMRQSALRSGFAGEFILWPPGIYPQDCPPHREVPFAFKPYCFQAARRRGQELALWLDASCVVVGSLSNPLFQQIEETGYLLFNNHDKRVGEWASDEALARLAVTREEALSMPEIQAAAIGLNLASTIGAGFLDGWLAAAQDGVSFRGVREGGRAGKDYYAVKWNKTGRASTDPRVRGHRHDQTVAGILAARLGMQLAPAGLQAYSRESGKIDPRTVILVDRSVARQKEKVTPLPRILGEPDNSFWASFLRRLGLETL